MITYVFEKTSVKTAFNYEHIQDIILIYFNLEDSSKQLNIDIIEKYYDELMINPNLGLVKFKNLYNKTKEFKKIKNDYSKITEDQKFLIENYEKMNNSKYYNLIFKILDFFISISPLIILSFSKNDTDKTLLYTFIQYLIFFTTIHPIFKLIYNFNKNLKSENSQILFHISLNIGVFICALIIPIGSLENIKNLEQSNKFLFGIFGIICLIKIIYILIDIIKLFPKLVNIFKSFNNIYIFLKNMMYIMISIIIIFMVTGQILFGGKINKNSIKNFNTVDKYLENNYQILNFNGVLNSFIFLISMFFQNKWSDFTEILLYINSSFASIIYLVLINLILNFLLPKLIIGFIVYSLIINVNNSKESKNFNKFNCLG